MTQQICISAGYRMATNFAPPLFNVLVTTVSKFSHILSNTCHHLKAPICQDHTAKWGIWFTCSLTTLLWYSQVFFYHPPVSGPQICCMVIQKKLTLQNFGKPSGPPPHPVWHIFIPIPSWPTPQLFKFLCSHGCKKVFCLQGNLLCIELIYLSLQHLCYGADHLPTTTFVQPPNWSWHPKK